MSQTTSPCDDPEPTVTSLYSIFLDSTGIGLDEGGDMSPTSVFLHVLWPRYGHSDPSSVRRSPSWGTLPGPMASQQFPASSSFRWPRWTLLIPRKCQASDASKGPWGRAPPMPTLMHVAPVPVLAPGCYLRDARSICLFVCLVCRLLHFVVIRFSGAGVVVGARSLQCLFLDYPGCEPQAVLA